MKEKLIFILILFNFAQLSGCSDVTQKHNDQKIQAEMLYQEAEKYYLGQGTSQNYKKAFTLFEKAAKQGSAAAQNDLASMYFQGLSTQQDYEKAFFWFSKSAQQNFPEA